MDFKEFSEGSQNVKATVKTDNYSWGKMKTVHHGSSFSIPLHPEHHEAIAKLKDQQEHKFKDETGRHWTAKRDGEDVHFQGANGGNKTKVAHKSIAENAPVAPVPDKKYIKGTPENKALKALRKPINGMPTNKMKEETMPQSFKGFLTSLTELTDKQKKHIDKNNNGKIDDHDFKLLRKEEDELDEAMINGREYASHGLMHPDHANRPLHKVSGQTIDFYAHGSGDKVQGKVVYHDEKQVHIKDTKGKKHVFKISKDLPKTTNEETKKDDIPFDGPYTKTPSTVKDKSGAVHTPMSRARDLARKAMQKKMKEEFNIEITEEQAADLCDVASINEKLDMKNADMGDVIKDFQKSDAPQFAGKSDKKRREMAIAAKMQSEETEGESTVKSYKDFVTEIKMADLPSRSVKGTSYGAQYHDPEGDDDADSKKPAKASDAPKRGRGRPSGSKSGAKQQGSEKSSNYGGIDRTTYALRLPNNNK